MSYIRQRDRQYYVTQIKNTIIGHYGNVLRYRGVTLNLDGLYVPKDDTHTAFIFYDWSQFPNIELKLMYEDFARLEGIVLRKTADSTPEHPGNQFGLHINWYYNGYYGFREDGTRLPVYLHEDDNRVRKIRTVEQPSLLPRSARR